MSDDQAQTLLPVFPANDPAFEKCVKEQYEATHSFLGISLDIWNALWMVVGPSILIFVSAAWSFATEQKGFFETSLTDLIVTGVVVTVVAVLTRFALKPRDIVAQIARHGRELCLENTSTKWNEVQHKLAGKRYADADFAEVARDTRVNMMIADGTGRERGTVLITVEWLASKRFNPTLYLYRDQGAIQTDVNVLRKRSSAIALYETKHGRHVEKFPDNNDVKDGKAYYYYAWIEVEFYGVPLLVTLEAKPHIARFPEDRETFLKRATRERVLENQHRAARLEPQSIQHELIAKIEECFKFGKTKREAINVAEAFIKTFDELDEVELAELEEAAFRTIDAFSEKTKPR